MSTPSDPLLTITFKGHRFDDHGIDLRDLTRLLAARNVLVKYAEDIWRQDHGGKNPPKGFSESISLRIYRVDPGSAAFDIYDETVESQPDDAVDDRRQLSLIKEAKPHAPRSARQRNKDAARRMSQDVLAVATNKEHGSIPRDALPHFKQFAGALTSDDSYLISVPDNDTKEEPKEPSEAAAPATVAARPLSYGGYSPQSTYQSPAKPELPSSPSAPKVEPVVAKSEPVVVDNEGRERWAKFISDQRPHKTPDAVVTDEYGEDVLIEGDLSKAIIFTEHGDSVSIEFSGDSSDREPSATDAPATRVHFVGRGVRDPKTKKIVRITSISSVKVVNDRVESAQLDLPIIPSASAVGPPDAGSTGSASLETKDIKEDSSLTLTQGSLAVIHDNMLAEQTLDRALAAVDSPRGPLSKKSDRVRAAVREALIRASSYDGNIEKDMEQLLGELRTEAVAKGLLSDATDDDKPDPDKPGDENGSGTGDKQ